MEKQIMKTFHINGFIVEAAYSEHFLSQIHILLDTWVALQKKKKRRIIVYLAAPPGAGKSTLAALIADLAEERKDCPLQVLGMDGFHHFQSYIQTHTVLVDGEEIPMKQVKGCPESFDFERLHSSLQKLQQTQQCWCPIYDRKLHDVVEKQLLIDAPILLVEGNYMLLDEEPWRILKKYCDDSIFLEMDRDVLKQRLIQRKMMGGTPPHAAVAFYEHSEQRNIERILAHRRKANHTIRYEHDSYILKE